MTLSSLQLSPLQSPTPYAVSFGSRGSWTGTNVSLTMPGKPALPLDKLVTDIGAKPQHIPLLRHIVAEASRRFDNHGHKLIGTYRLLTAPGVLPLLERLEKKPYKLIGAGSTALVFKAPGDTKVTKLRWTGTLFPHMPAADIQALVQETPSVRQFVWVTKAVASEGDLVLETQPWAPPVPYKTSRKEGFRERIRSISHGLARRGVLLWDFPRDNFGRRKGIIKLTDVGALSPKPELKTMTEAERQKTCQHYLEGIV